MRDLVKLGFIAEQTLTNSDLWNWVEHVLKRIISERVSKIVGVSGLTTQGDLLFARFTHASGTPLHIIRVAGDFEPPSILHQYRDECFDLLNKSAMIESVDLPRIAEPHHEIKKRIVDLSNILIAVWEKEQNPSVDKMGEIVRYAITAGKPIIHINPLEMCVHNISAR